MYNAILILHSIMRWFVILAAILALVRAWNGWISKKEWTAADDRSGLLFSIGMDVQVLLGLLLYFFLSPAVRTAFSDFGAAMANNGLRYWAVEHITIMIVALAILHIGRARSKKAQTPAAKHKTAAVFYTISSVLILAGIPWPFFTYGRPLL